jgi:hypothetical protein
VDYGPAENFHKMVRVSEGGIQNSVDCLSRLNTKIEPRELVVVDLVKDLSDGVSMQGNQLQIRS